MPVLAEHQAVDGFDQALVGERLVVVVANSSLEFLAFTAFSRTSRRDTRFAGGVRVATCATTISGRTWMCSAQHGSATGKRQRFVVCCHLRSYYLVWLL